MWNRVGLCMDRIYFFLNKLLLIVQPPLTSVIDFTRVMVRKSAGEIWGRLLV